MKATRDNVIIEPITQKKCGEIILIENRSPQTLTGKVVSAGIGIDKPLSVKEGDSVLFSNYNSFPIPNSSQNWIIVKDSDIMAIL